MRLRHLGLLALTLILLPACGGGLEAPPIEQSKVTVDGGVTEIDGETADRAGVELLCRETGERVVTGPDGGFTFTADPAGSITIALERVPGDVRPDILPDPCARELDDELERDDDNSPNEVALDELTPGEKIRLRLRIADGRLERVDIARDKDDRRRVKFCMRRTDANDDPNMKGCLIVVKRNDGLHAGVVVKCATPKRDLELFVIDRENEEEETQGIRTVGERGMAAWRFKNGELPFGAASLRELAGLYLVVRDATTEVSLLVGKFPELPEPCDDRSARGKARLTPHEFGLKGYIAIGAKQDCETERLRQRFRMVALGLDEGRIVEFFIQDPDVPNTFRSLGMRAASAEGDAVVDLDTADGELLPLGVERVSELVGLLVEVRDAGTEALLLDGEVPVLMAD